MHFLELRFGLIDLSDRQEQFRAINPFRIRLRNAIVRVVCQRLEQVPVAVRREGTGEGLIDCRAQLQFVRVQDRWVIKAPLNDVDGVNDGRPGRRLPGLHRPLFARFQVNLPALVLQRDQPFEQ